MKSKIAFALLVSAAMGTSAFAQSQPAAQPAVIEQQPVTAAVSTEAVLPANTDIALRLSDQIASNTHRTGDTFPLTVVNDVTVGGHVVIPAGTRAMGQVTWRTGRGGFGKSGKLEVQLRYIELNGQRIPVTGFHRQEGDGNTAGTIGATLAVGVIGGMLVRGGNARIPAGRELTALTVDAIPVSLGEGRLASIAAAYQPTAFGTDLGRRRDANASRQSRSECIRQADARARGDHREQMRLEQQCRNSGRASRT